jgi:type I site-specific restriction endonuclease
MKKGKTSKLNVFDDAKCYYGTVDSKNLKSIYLVLQTWVEPINEYDNWTKITGEIKRKILHTLLEVVDYTTFEKKQIVDLDLRTSGIQYKKRSFMNLEINLFLINEIDFKSPELEKSIKDIVSSIHNDVFKGNEYFKFHVSKKDKSELVEA